MKVKKIILLLASLILANLVFAQENSERYSKLMEEGKKLETEGKTVSAMAFYYDAMKEGTDPVEAFESYDKIYKAFQAGNPGTGTYDSFSIYDSWIVTLTDFETYWAQHPQDIYEIFYDLKDDGLDMEKRTGKFLIYSTLFYTQKFYEILNSVVSGLNKSWNKSWTQIPGNWPADSILKTSEFNTIKTVDSSMLVPAESDEPEIEFLAAEKTDEDYMGDKPDPIVEKPLITIFGKNRSGQGLIEPGKEYIYQTPFWNACSSGSDNPDEFGKNFAYKVEFEISDLENSFTTSVIFDLPLFAERLSDSMDKNGQCSSFCVPKNYQQFEVPGKYVEDFKKGQLTVNCKNACFYTYKVKTELQPSSKNWQKNYEDFTTVETVKVIETVKNEKVKSLVSNCYAYTKNVLKDARNKTYSKLFYETYPPENFKYTNKSILRGERKLCGINIDYSNRYDSGSFLVNGDWIPSSYISARYPFKIYVDRNSNYLYRDLTYEETSRFIREEKLEIMKKEIGGKTENYYVNKYNKGSYPVSQILFTEVMGYNPSENADELCAVENISFYEAMVFCNRLSLLQNKVPVYTVNKSTNPDDWGKIPEAEDKVWIKYKVNESANGYAVNNSPVEPSSKADTDMTVAEKFDFYTYSSGTAFEMYQIKRMIYVVDAEKNQTLILPYEKQKNTAFRVCVFNR